MRSRTKLSAIISTLANGAIITTSTAATAAEALEEIIVTATRREQNVLDVPYNISAYSAEDLARSHVTDFSDFSRMVAGLTYLDQGPDVRGNVNTFILRGLGGSAANANAGVPRISTAPVSTYIGEAPVFFSLTTTDLERVEVLRGPQGTLYGSGSSGGTIRFIPRRPDTSQRTLDISGDFSGTDSSDDVNYSMDGVLNFPIGDSLAVRVTGGYREQAGFVDANGILALDENKVPILADPDDIAGSPPVLLPKQKDVNDAQSWYARAALLWNYSDSTDFLFSWHHQDDEVDDRQAHNPDFAGDGFFPANGDYEQSFKIHEPYTRDVDLLNLEVNIDFGFATLTSATSYFDNDSTQTYDVSGFGEQFLFAYYYFFPRLIAPADEITDDTGFVQELRLASRGNGEFDWVAGAFYQDTKSDYFSNNYVPGYAEYYNAVVGFDPGTEVGLVITRELKSEDVAMFGEVTWHVTDAWQVTGGIRAFWGSFDQDYLQQLPLCGALCANDGVDPLGTTAAVSSKSYNDQVLKFNTSYDFTDDLTAYFTWAEGYRHEGANALPTAGNFAEDPSLLTFGPDSANNFEIGLKGTIADRVQFSAAAFYITWEDFQFDSFAPVSGLQFVGNANEARSQGIELEGAAGITEHLTANLGYTYTDAELTEDFVVSSVEGFEGDSMPGIPKHSLTWNADYTYPLSGDYGLRFHINGMYRSDTESDWNPVSNFGRRFFPIDSFSIWDLSLTFAAGERWTATAFVDNVGNEEGTTGGVPPANYSPRGAYFMVVRPRTVGLRMTYSIHE